MTAPAGPAAGAFPPHRFALRLLLIVLLVWAGLLAFVVRSAVLPDSAAGIVLVVFPPATRPDEIFSALLRADGIVVRRTWLDNAWLVYSGMAGLVGRLKAAGAWAAFEPLAFDPAALGGCFMLSRSIAKSASATTD